MGPQAFSYNADVDFDGTYLAAQIYSQYETAITGAVGKGTIEHDLKWLMPCFAEDVARVLENEVRDIKKEIRAKYVTTPMLSMSKVLCNFRFTFCAFCQPFLIFYSLTIKMNIHACHTLFYHTLSQPTTPFSYSTTLPRPSHSQVQRRSLH
jgi:hypothetical protein